MDICKITKNNLVTLFNFTFLENALGFILLFLVFGVRLHGKSLPRQFKDDMFFQNR